MTTHHESDTGVVPEGAEPPAQVPPEAGRNPARPDANVGPGPMPESKEGTPDDVPYVRIQPEEGG